MKRFIHRENLRHLRELLNRTASEEECRRIVKFIEEEELNYRASADDLARKSAALDSADKALRPAHR